MTFSFEILCISKLPEARVAVLDGKVLTGSVTTDSTVELVHRSHHFPVRVKGVVLGSLGPGNSDLSITVDLHEEAMQVVAVGDRLVCCRK